jgi:hypothetical protein
LNLGRIYRAILKRAIRQAFPLAQRLGFHLSLNHFYEPIPDTARLSDDVWRERTEPEGVDLREKEQVLLLEAFKTSFRLEYDAFPRFATGIADGYYVYNKSFESVDGEVLYCMIRSLRPKKIIEIGAGYSTLLSARAILKNEQEDGHRCELIAIDPFPSEILRRGFPGLTRVIAKEVQQVPLEEFTALGENDVLFIDSSHVAKIGSDVQYELLEILPRIGAGVAVHLHDIFLPSEYPQDWVLSEHKFFNEQYLLQAFMSFNREFEVLWAGSFMHLKHPELLEAAFASYRRETTWPGSFWLRRSTANR